MARLIGKRPTYPGETEFYDFAMKELPDYVYVMFNVRFPMGKNMTLGPDALLLVPHIGVFVVEIKAYTNMSVKQDKLVVGKDKMVDPRTYHLEKLIELRNMTSHYIQEKFHVTPFVYEMHCFPKVNSTPEIKDALARTLGAELFFFADDLVDRDEFLLKLNICRAHMNKMTEDRNQFCDLTDAMAHNMYKHWDTGMDDPARPSKPPFVFLSYNRRNLQVAEEIKAELENRGIFVWKAPEDVPLGEYYLPEEMKAIEACDSFLILLSMSSQDSKEVKKEFDKAVEIKKHIVPIKIQDMELNDFYEKSLTGIQYKNMYNLDVNVMNEIETCIRDNLAQ